MTFELDHSRKAQQQQKPETKPWDGNPVAPKEPERAPAPKLRPTPHYIYSGYSYAGFWDRVIAHFIDAIIMLLMSWMFYECTLLLPTITLSKIHIPGLNLIPLPNDVMEHLDLMGYGFLPGLLYYTLTTGSSMQGTFGKQIRGLYVIRADGVRIGYVHACWRWLCYYIHGLIMLIPATILGMMFYSNILFVLTGAMGLFMIGFTREKTALHDLLANTRVVYGKPD